MSKNVEFEKELYSPMSRWLESYLLGLHKNSEIIVLDTSQYSLENILTEYEVINEYPHVIGTGIQIDVLGIVKKKKNSLLYFIEAKKTSLNTHDLGQILIYCRICNPNGAFLFSSESIGALGKLLLQNQDLLRYSNDNVIKMIQIARWDILKELPDMSTIIPKL